jgi:hypothetical protein
MSLWGVAQLITIKEILKGQRTTKTDKKIYLVFCIVFVITILVFIINSANNGFNLGGLIGALAVEVLVMILTLASASAIVYFSYHGLEIIMLVPLFFFFLCSHLNASGHGFLSFLAGIPVVLLLVAPIIGLFAYIFDKNLRYASSGDNSNYEPKVKEEPKKVEIKEDLMYYHYKTEIHAETDGAPYRSSLSGLYYQKFSVDATFYYKNCNGKEKTKHIPFAMDLSEPNVPTAKDAEELNPSFLHPIK